MEVEEDPGGVADEKDEDNAEKDERLPVVLTQLLRVRGWRGRAHQLKDKTKSWALLHWHILYYANAENTHLLCKGKYQCMADLLFDWFGFDQTSKADAYSTKAKQLNPNKIYRSYYW